MPADARKAVENAYATIEMTDAVAVIGTHQVALVRGYGQQLQAPINALQADIVNADPVDSGLYIRRVQSFGEVHFVGGDGAPPSPDPLSRIMGSNYA